MSRMVNCPNDVLQDLYSKENLWPDVIKQLNHVRVPDKNPIDLSSYVKDQPENIWEVLDRDGVKVHDRNAFVNEAFASPSKMLAHPSDIYVYEDVPKADGYGVLVSAPGSKNYRCLFRQWKYTAKQGEEYSWKDFLKRFHVGEVPPSNGLVIIDRYLFSNNYKNGIRNLYALFEELLPSSSKREYHILLIFDEEQIGGYARLQDVASDLQKMKREINRPYVPVIEILTVNQEQRDIYAETHDRRIVSNYFTIHATRGFSAFKPKERDEKHLISIWSQDLSFTSIFVGIDNEDQDKESLPVRNYQLTLNALRKYILGLSEGDRYNYHYICDGNFNADVRNLKNRLIRKDFETDDF